MARLLSLGGLTVNRYLLKNSAGYILIDTGRPGSYPAFLRALGRHGLSPRHVDCVFLTHAHADHAGLLRQLLEANPSCRLIASQEALPALRMGRNASAGGYPGSLARRVSLMMSPTFPALPPELESRLLPVRSDTQPALEVALRCRILLTPGHTACSISLLSDGLLFCGDAAMNGFPSQRRIPILIENPGDFCSSWRAILRLSPKALYPGHGRPFSPADLARFLLWAEKITLRP